MMRCACGKPLHYTDANVKTLVELTILRMGEFVPVHVGDRSYRVSRHYLALHGIKARELEALAEKGLVERLEPKS